MRNAKSNSIGQLNTWRIGKLANWQINIIVYRKKTKEKSILFIG